VATATTPSDISIQAGNAQLYRQIGKVKLLTPEQERDLARRIERGDFAAKTLLVEANLRLVASIAKSYTGPGWPWADAFQEGVIGLIRAAEKFDYRKGYRFSTYASLWIREAILRGIQGKGRLVHLPADVWRTASRIRRCRSALTAQHGREPSSQEIAETLGIAEEQVRLITQSFRDTVSLNSGTQGAPDTELGDTLESTPAPDGEPSAALRDAIARGLGTLERRAREVIELRYGVGGCTHACSVTEAAKRLGLPRTKLREVERGAMSMLTPSLAAWAPAAEQQTVGRAA